MHIQEQDLNKITDALMSAQRALARVSDSEGADALAAVIVAQSFIVNAKDAKASGALREAAMDRITNEFHACDEIEIDDDAGTSEAANEGTWVQAWVYVPKPERDECRTEGCDGEADDGEGWNGYCGNCADRLEAEGEERERSLEA